MLNENTAGGAGERPEEEKPEEQPTTGSETPETPETGSDAPASGSETPATPEPAASEPPAPTPAPPPPAAPAVSEPPRGGGGVPPRGVDNSEVDGRTVLQVFLLTTGVFLIVALLIYVVASLPTSPNFRPADFYDTQEWEQAEPLQREQLQEYGARQVEVQRQNEEGETVTEMVTEYTIPIEEAKQLLIERGLPVRGEDGAADAAAADTADSEMTGDAAATEEGADAEQDTSQ